MFQKAVVMQYNKTMEYMPSSLCLSTLQDWPGNACKVVPYTVGLIATLTVDAGAAPDGSATGGGYSSGSADQGPAGVAPADQGPDQGADQGAGQPSTGTGQADNSADSGTPGGDLVDFLRCVLRSDGPLHTWLASCEH